MKIKIRKDLAYRRVAGEVFIVDAARSELHELNGPAALIWEGLASGKTEKALVSAMTAEFEADEKTVRADMDGFIGELLESGLVEGHL
jgi:hypothetical protein